MYGDGCMVTRQSVSCYQLINLARNRLLLLPNGPTKKMKIQKSGLGIRSSLTDKLGYTHTNPTELNDNKDAIDVTSVLS